MKNYVFSIITMVCAFFVYDTLSATNQQNYQDSKEQNSVHINISGAEARGIDGLGLKISLPCTARSIISAVEQTTGLEVDYFIEPKITHEDYDRPLYLSKYWIVVKALPTPVIPPDPCLNDDDDCIQGPMELIPE